MDKIDASFTCREGQQTHDQFLGVEAPNGSEQDSSEKGLARDQYPYLVAGVAELDVEGACQNDLIVTVRGHIGWSPQRG